MSSISMFSVPHPPPGGAPPYSKLGIVFRLSLCPILLAISAYGAWQWFIKVTVISHLVKWEELFYLTALILVPLALLIFLSITASKKLEYNRLTMGYRMRIDQIQNRLSAQENFVRLITDSNLESIVIYDQDNRYWFANRSAAKNLGYEAGELVKRQLGKIVGYDRAQKIEKRLSDVRAKKKPIEFLDEVKADDGQTNFVQARYEFMPASADFTNGVLVRETDVTSLIVERERRANMLRQVISTLVAVVDRRDPYASGHSARVGQLSRMVGEELLLSEKEIDAAEVAGSLMNFGKVLVPRKILTKASALTPEELQSVRDSILTSADILSIIDFEGPVVQTLRQVMERYDGTGTPEGLKGHEIIVTARILAVTNTFVALASPRAHRPSLPIAEVMAILMKGSDTIYDRQIVTALSNCVKNRRDMLDWIMTAKQN